MYVHHIAITVKNLTESIKFYSDVFGFKYLTQYEKGNSKFAYLSLEDFQLELWEFTPVTTADNLESLDVIGLRHLGFAVKNIDESVAKAKELHVDFSEPKLGTSGKRYSLGTDCNGIAIELLEVKE
jgi:catechol 2,3-dioxygenase-like lactoylglutathione lyase family enzyme